jgi:DDE domain
VFEISAKNGRLPLEDEQLQTSFEKKVLIGIKSVMPAVDLDEIYIKVKGGWKYLYRAIDIQLVIVVARTRMTLIRIGTDVPTCRIHAL